MKFIDRQTKERIVITTTDYKSQGEYLRAVSIDTGFKFQVPRSHFLKHYRSYV